jgi:hypothetical protein
MKLVALQMNWASDLRSWASGLPAPCEGGREPKASGGVGLALALFKCQNQTPRSRRARSLPPFTGGRG